jgi:isocitrate dehydrogenase
MGSVLNVGLMAQKQKNTVLNKTFQMTASGVVRVVDTKGNVVMEQTVDTEHFFRICVKLRMHLFKTGLNLL